MLCLFANPYYVLATYVYMYIRTDAYMHICTYAYMYICVDTFACVCTLHACMHPYIHTYMYTYICIIYIYIYCWSRIQRTSAYMHAYLHRNLLMRTYLCHIVYILCTLEIHKYTDDHAYVYVHISRHGIHKLWTKWVSRYHFHFLTMHHPLGNPRPKTITTYTSTLISSKYPT